MAVVEVLESHMDSMVVQHMKQSSSLKGKDSGSRALSLLNCDPYGPQVLFSFKLPELGAEEPFILTLVQQTIPILWLVTLARKKAFKEGRDSFDTKVPGYGLSGCSLLSVWTLGGALWCVSCAASKSGAPHVLCKSA